MLSFFLNVLGCCWCSRLDAMCWDLGDHLRSFILWMYFTIQINDPLLFWENDVAEKWLCSGDPGDQWIISASWGFLTCWKGREAVWQIHAGIYLLLCYPLLAANRSQSGFFLTGVLFPSLFNFFYFTFFFPACKLPFSVVQELHWPRVMRCSVLHFPLCLQLFS